MMPRICPSPFTTEGRGLNWALICWKRSASSFPGSNTARSFWKNPKKSRKSWIDAKAGSFLGGTRPPDLPDAVLRAYGMTSAASCIIPRENSEMFDLVKKGRLEEARKIYLSAVCPLNAMAFFSVLDFIAAYKLALYWMESSRLLR